MKKSNVVCGKTDEEKKSTKNGKKKRNLINLVFSLNVVDSLSVLVAYGEFLQLHQSLETVDVDVSPLDIYQVCLLDCAYHQNIGKIYKFRK